MFLASVRFSKWCAVFAVAFLGLVCVDSLQADEDALKHEAIVAQEFIFTEAPFKECHASTIAQLPDGGLVAAWFGGTRESRPDVGIWVSRQVDGKWTAPVEVADGVQSPEKRYPCWNPVLFQPSKGPLMLFFKVGPSPSEWWGELMISDDGGRTWKNRRKLPKGFDGPVKNKPVEMKDGSIWCPSSTEYDGWRVHIEVTPDQGKTWRKIGPLNDGKKVGAIQPSILLYDGGKRIQLLCRDKRGMGNVWQVWSEDGGRTWGEFTSTGLPNPNSGTDAVTLDDGLQVLVYNNSVRVGPFPAGRQILNVASSRDGKHWTAGPVLEKRAGWEFSYPAVIQANDGLVHVVYTWGRTRIKHVTLDPKKL